MTLEAAISRSGEAHGKAALRATPGRRRNDAALCRAGAMLQAEHDALQSDHAALLAELRRKSEEVEAASSPCTRR